MSNYSDVKNYLHNDLGISKEYVKETILKTIQEEISKLFKDSSRLEYLIRDMIKKEIKHDDHKILYRTLRDVNGLIEDTLTDTVINEIKNKVKLSIVQEPLKEESPLETKIRDRIDFLAVNILENEYALESDKDKAEIQVDTLREVLEWVVS